MFFFFENPGKQFPFIRQNACHIKILQIPLYITFLRKKTTEWEGGGMFTQVSGTVRLAVVFISCCCCRCCITSCCCCICCCCCWPVQKFSLSVMSILGWSRKVRLWEKHTKGLPLTKDKGTARKFKPDHVTSQEKPFHGHFSSLDTYITVDQETQSRVSYQSIFLVWTSSLQPLPSLYRAGRDFHMCVRARSAAGTNCTWRGVGGGGEWPDVCSEIQTSAVPRWICLSLFLSLT